VLTCSWIRSARTSPKAGAVRFYERHGFAPLSTELVANCDVRRFGPGREHPVLVERFIYVVAR